MILKRKGKVTMALLNYECTHEKDFVCFKISGFNAANETIGLKEAIISELKSMEGRPFKVMFDLRGLNAFDPNALKQLEEIDNYLSECSVTKIGVLFDGNIIKEQYTRTLQKSKAGEMLETSRFMIFTNPNQCLAWLRGAKLESAS